jgi:hypothetical protein
MPKKEIILGLAAVLLAAAGGVRAADEVICGDAKLAFTPPGDDWRVNTELVSPVAAGLENSKLNGTITITYTDYELYGFKVNYGFLKDKLEKNEKNSFKLTKPNYERISLKDKKFSYGKTARLEFATTDELGAHRTVVYAVANGTTVYFCSAESLEREWPLVEADFEKLMASIRFTP